MEKIPLSLKNSDQLLASEKVQEVPELVSEYQKLENKEHKSTGKFFRVLTRGENRDSKTDGIAYLNEMTVEMKVGNSWKQIYCTGMQQYRGAYNWEIDNWDLAIYQPVILRESKNDALVAFRTGIGNIKIYTFTKKGHDYSKMVVFNWNDYTKQGERIELVKNMLNDAKLFKEYIRKSLRSRWDVRETKNLNDVLTLAYARHASRDYDASTDQYQFSFLVKGRGIAVSEIFYSGLRETTSKFSTNYANLKDVKLVSFDEKQAVVEIEMMAEQYGWEGSHCFVIRF